jgi:hypothetical protein
LTFGGEGYPFADCHNGTRADGLSAPGDRPRVADARRWLGVGTPKARRGRRVVLVDIFTAELLQEHQRIQDAE